MNQRQMEILTSLSNLEMLTRSQIQQLHDTKSIRNTNFIMKGLKPYVNVIRLKENAYYLNKKGVALVGAKKQFEYSDQINHKLMRNDAHIYFNPTNWKIEQEIKVRDVIVVPDAFFYSGSSYKFLEVDNTQKWHVNVTKMEQYKKLKDTGAFQQQYGHFPAIVWVVKFESRKEKLKKLAKEMDLVCDIYLHDEIK
ncbi:replication-relaxation family protein [Terrihalobacillus insolitus]|uniref:replication-relaxation family protein n=1 Tax=Terrihalobacillus insolitus TaxID=2950438 RepID=UPI002341714B|nr:replication-relaxation family protein [Terrihalobacillus insolitus]MDC3414247.1 replication-relaxation family protein [Terrihalobacillus insolitus]